MTAKTVHIFAPGRVDQGHRGITENIRAFGRKQDLGISEFVPYH